MEKVFEDIKLQVEKYKEELEKSILTLQEQIANEKAAFEKKYLQTEEYKSLLKVKEELEESLLKLKNMSKNYENITEDGVDVQSFQLNYTDMDDYTFLYEEGARFYRSKHFISFAGINAQSFEELEDSLSRQEKFKKYFQLCEKYKNAKDDKKKEKVKLQIDEEVKNKPHLKAYVFFKEKVTRFMQQTEEFFKLNQERNRLEHSKQLGEKEALGGLDSQLIQEQNYNRHKRIILEKILVAELCYGKLKEYDLKEEISRESFIKAFIKDINIAGLNDCDIRKNIVYYMIANKLTEGKLKSLKAEDKVRTFILASKLDKIIKDSRKININKDVIEKQLLSIEREDGLTRKEILELSVKVLEVEQEIELENRKRELKTLLSEEKELL